MTNISRPVSIWRRVLLYAILFFVLYNIQLYPAFWLNVPAPDFLLLLPVVVGLARGGTEGFVIGLISGFLRDYAVGRLYGLGMLEGMILGLIAGMFFINNRELFWKRLLLLGLAVTLVHEFAMTSLAFFFPLDRELSLSFPAMLKNSASNLAFTLVVNLIAAVLILCFLWLGFYQRKKQRQKSGTDVYGGFNRAL